MFQGINAPSRIEVELDDLEIEGQLPRDPSDERSARPSCRSRCCRSPRGCACGSGGGQSSCGRV
jgi:hypothetical protein